MRIILFLILSTLIFALDKSNYYDFGNEFDAKHFVLPTESADSIQVIVMFRVANKAISFRNVNGKFTSVPIVDISFRDETGITRARKQWKENYSVETFNETNSKDDYLNGFFEFRLANKNYDIDIKYYQSLNSNPESIELKLQQLFDEKEIGINPLFFKSGKSDFVRIEPFIKKSGYLFESQGGSLIVPILSESNSNYYFTLKKIETPKTDKRKKRNKDDKEKEFSRLMDWGGKIDIDGTCEVSDFSSAKITREKNRLRISFDQRKGQNSLLKIKLPTETLTPGLYKLKILKGDEVISDFVFPLEWETKPVSLLDPEFAINKMYYILNDIDFEKYKSLDDELLFQKLIEYWKRQDPTPNTPFNEKMTQYFSRVDYSFFNFSTLAQKDGAETDRGKVYILKGNPSKVVNTTIEEQEWEFWEYYDLGKIYRFELVASGVYKLKTIDEIN